MSRRLSPILTLLLVVVVACTGNADPSTTTSEDGTPSTTVTTVEEETTTTERDVTTTTAEAPPVTEPDLSGLEGVSDEVRAQLEDLIGVAQEIRELPFLDPPVITIVTEDELEALVREDIEEEAEDFPADEALYKMLGLLNEAADFEQIVLDLYGEQVAGYYDGDTGEIVVPAREDGFSLLQQGTLVHELVHAITDQHFGFNDTFQAMIDEERLDEATAYQALIEGDATLAEVLWVQSLGQREIGEFLAESLEIDTAALDAAPRFLTESLLFPYDSGLAFAQDLYIDGGAWGDVNEAYRLMPGLPASTEQVITPDDYQRDLPLDVTLPAVDVGGYELERTSVWGEQGFRILLNQGDGARSVATAVDGWGGDSYHQWFDGENAAILIAYSGDTQADVDELEQALLGFANQNFPEENFVWVEQLDGTLYFIAANEKTVGESIRATAGLD
ncbi:MAG TPA: hypothetical protein VF148_12650 [Acidimicrobiia bacterium]